MLNEEEISISDEDSSIGITWIESSPIFKQSPNTGEIFFNTYDNLVYLFDGSKWIQMSC